MGRKKHKREGKHEKRHHAEPSRPSVPPEVAALAAAAIAQVNTPAFRQMMAGALGAAAQAFNQRRSSPRPDAPVPPVAPAYQARSEPPEPRLSPDTAQAIDRVADQAGQAIERAAAIAADAIDRTAGALERWMEKQVRPRADPHGADTNG